MDDSLPAPLGRRRLLSGLAAAGALAAAGCRSDRDGDTSVAGGPGASIASATSDDAALAPATSAAPTSTGASAPPAPAAARAPAADDPALHVALRLTYGLQPGLLEEIGRLGVEGFVRQQLDPATLADPPELTAALQSFRLANLPAADLIAARRDDATVRGRAAAELVAQTVLRQLRRPAQLHEQLVEFWTNHFSIHLAEGQQFALKPDDDRDVIRRHALGRFADLLAASAQSPAMLISLDNAASRVGAINENYGRELLELHTVGVDGGYTEADVVAVANTLTGWTVERTQGTFRFAPRLHDTSPQQVMTWRTPAGRDGFAVGLDVLDFLAHHERTAAHLARKLCVRFVSDRPDPGLVAAVARAYLDNDTAIAPTLRALFGDERFVTAATAKYRRPHELFVAAVRATGATLDTAALGRVNVRRGFSTALGRLGQVPYDWPAPNGYPDVGGAWLGPGGLLARWNAVGDLMAGSIPGVTLDLASLRTTAAASGTGAAAALDALALRLVGAPLDGPTRDAVLTGIGANATAPLPTDDRTLRTAVTLLLASPRFQYR